MPLARPDEMDLARLRAFAPTKPRTKAGQVRQAWPEIRNLLAAGHALKDVCTWVNEIGIKISYTRLSDYVNQLRRAEREQADARSLSATALAPAALLTSPALNTDKTKDTRATQDSAANVSPSEPAPAPDPLANIRRELERKRTSGFHYSPFPDNGSSEATNRDTNVSRQGDPKPHDPMANVRRTMEKRKGTTFDYRPELADPKELL